MSTTGPPELGRLERFESSTALKVFLKHRRNFRNRKFTPRVLFDYFFWEEKGMKNLQSYKIRGYSDRFGKTDSGHTYEREFHLNLLVETISNEI